MIIDSAVWKPAWASLLFWSLAAWCLGALGRSKVHISAVIMIIISIIMFNHYNNLVSQFTIRWVRELFSRPGISRTTVPPSVKTPTSPQGRDRRGWPGPSSSQKGFCTRGRGTWWHQPWWSGRCCCLDHHQHHHLLNSLYEGKVGQHLAPLPEIHQSTTGEQNHLTIEDIQLSNFWCKLNFTVW